MDTNTFRFKALALLGFIVLVTATLWIVLEPPKPRWMLLAGLPAAFLGLAVLLEMRQRGHLK